MCQCQKLDKDAVLRLLEDAGPTIESMHRQLEEATAAMHARPGRRRRRCRAALHAFRIN